MSNVVSFRPRSGAAADLSAMAQRVIEERGLAAGWDVICAARMPGISAATAASLLSLAGEIERIQGFGSHVSGGA